MSEKVLLAYSNGISKKGNPYLRLSIGFPYSQSAIDKGFIGYNVQDRFANPDVLKMLSVDMIGKTVDLAFGCNDNGFPEIISVKVVK